MYVSYPRVPVAGRRCAPHAPHDPRPARADHGKPVALPQLPGGEVRALETPEQAANLLDSMLDEGDTVLFKASRGIGLEGEAKLTITVLKVD